MNPFQSLREYEHFVYALPDQFKNIQRSTLVIIQRGSLFAELTGEIAFADEYRLSVYERLVWDTGAVVIEGYSYEAWRGNEKLYWYDSQPHPHDPTLVVTQPHHKHIPPGIKHNRVPAPSLSFVRPNLAELIQEIEQISGEEEVIASLVGVKPMPRNHQGYTVEDYTVDMEELAKIELGPRSAEWNISEEGWPQIIIVDDQKRTEMELTIALNNSISRMSIYFLEKYGQDQGADYAARFFVVNRFLQTHTNKLERQHLIRRGPKTTAIDTRFIGFVLSRFEEPKSLSLFAEHRDKEAQGNINFTKLMKAWNALGVRKTKEATGLYKTRRIRTTRKSQATKKR